MENNTNANLPAVTREPSGTRSHSIAKWHLPELLAPAGNWACARAAVLNGADAVYFALGKFNARIRAENFSAEDLPKLMEYLHLHGVRGYACLNTVVFENELEEAEAYLRTMIKAGVDGVLVQDVGVARIARAISPDFPIHASTQMTITSAAGVEFARELGCSLVVLARECSIADIESIRSATRECVYPISLEIFVHGALCVSYSGQCFASRAIGGRSANRGDCAQVCRLPYDLMCDGRKATLGGRRYLLSAQDLAALELLPAIVRSGVSSLKIEGRLKSPEYVGAITRIYRNALDGLVSADSNGGESGEISRSGCEGDVRYEMEMAFSRGLCAGWLSGADHRAVVHGRFGKRRGVCIGKVVRVRGRSVVLRAWGDVKPGDGVVFDIGGCADDEPGGRVYGVRVLDEPAPEQEASREAETGNHGLVSFKELELSFGPGTIDSSRVKPGAEVWKTSDPELERRWRAMVEGGKTRYRRPIWFCVRGSSGEKMEVTVRDELGNEAMAASAVPLSPAESSPLTVEVLIEQLGRLGGTQFRLGGLRSELTGSVMLPLSELNRLRRALVTELERVRLLRKRWRLIEEPKAAIPRKIGRREPVRDKTALELAVLVRDLNQFEAAIGEDVSVVYCEFERLGDYRRVVEMCNRVQRHRTEQLDLRDHSKGQHGRATDALPALFAAPPRICRPGEEGVLEAIRACSPDGYLVRNYDHLKFFKAERCVGDFSFNVGNSIAAEYFKNKFGLERVTASYDMDINQLEALLRSVPPGWIEVTVYQHVPMLHMEHCVFCAFLSTGRNKKDCGRPCGKHVVRLRDRVGEEHSVRADACCRNTVFQGRAKSADDHIGRLIGLGARHFRIELLDENSDETARLIRKYSALLQRPQQG